MKSCFGDLSCILLESTELGSTEIPKYTVYVRFYAQCIFIQERILRLTHIQHVTRLSNDAFLLSSLLVLGDGLDDSNCLTHVTDDETIKRRGVGEILDAKGLLGLQVDEAGIISSLDELGVLFQNLTGTTVYLLHGGSEFAGNVSNVAIQQRELSVGDFSRVDHDNSMGLETGDSRGGAGFGVRGDVSASEILDGNVLRVETNVVTRDSLGKRLVVHFDGPNCGNNTGGGEVGMYTRLNDTSLNTTDGHNSDTTDLVSILERNTKGLLSGKLGRVNVVKGLEECWWILQPCYLPSIQR
jgi:hypothetical protein